LTGVFDYENRYQHDPHATPARMTLRPPKVRASLTALALGLGLAGGCAGQLRPVTPSDAIAASARWPGTTVADLQQGQRKYADHCSTCHALYRPEAFPAQKWQGFVAEMVVRAKLGPDDVRDIVRYLVTAADATRTPHTVAANGGAPTTTTH
jgi:mono/diheme cytochrome c family protein